MLRVSLSSVHIFRSHKEEVERQTHTFVCGLMRLGSLLGSLLIDISEFMVPQTLDLTLSFLGTGAIKWKGQVGFCN